MDSRPAANLQRVTAALSVAAGCQVSRWDRPKRCSCVRVDAEPDVPISKQGTWDDARGRMGGIGIGADFRVPLARTKPPGAFAGHTKLWRLASRHSQDDPAQAY